jgi:hypothetical protein
LSCCAFALPSDRIGDCGSFRSAYIHRNWSGLFVFAVIAGLSRLAGIAMVRASGDLAL